MPRLLFALLLLAASSLGAADLLVEDFEGKPRYGWWTEVDQNNLGTVMRPQPFVVEPGGAPGSVSASARIHGRLGAARAPWSWVKLKLAVNKGRKPADLSKYKSIHFWARGDGARYRVALDKRSLKSDAFNMTFLAPKEWTRIALPLDRFEQNGWGEKGEKSFHDVTAVSFEATVNDSPFDLSIDRVEFKEIEAKLEPRAYDTEGWIRWTGVDVGRRRGTALDVSRLLDAPAGKHGWLKAKGNDYVFEDGTPVRFWGVNIVASANFPEKKQAREIAEYLAQLGVNMTRHHHMDAPWTKPNIFGNKGSTLSLDKESMDRFDYFVSELQKRGIYQYMDLLVHRKAYAKDGIDSPADVVNGWKIEGEFAPELIELQKKFAKQLLGHKNPYTGKTYGKDPAVCMMEVINEDSLFYLHKDGDFSIQSPVYSRMLGRQFKDWLQKRYKTRQDLEQAWLGPGESKSALKPGEDYSKGWIEARVPFGGGEWQEVGKARAADTMRFYYDTMLDYFREIEKVIRKSGSKALVAGSNHWTAHPADLYLNAQLDYVDRHNYWDHATGGWSLDVIRHSNQAMVKHPGLGLIGDLARRRVLGKPYIITEWQVPLPNDYRQDANLIMAAYAGLQNWSAVQFAFSHAADKMHAEGERTMAGLFDVVEQPGMLAVWPTAALMAARGDFSAARSRSCPGLGMGQALDPDAVNPIDPRLGLITATGLCFDGEAGALQEAKALEAGIQEGWTVSDTRQLRHHPELGRFEMRSPRTQGFSGFYGDKTFRSSNMQVQVKNSYATVALTTLDDAPVITSSRLLLTAVGNAVNSGMKRSFSGDSIADAGQAPVLVEPIQASVQLKGLAKDWSKAKVYALDADGRRKGRLRAAVTRGNLQFEIGRDEAALHYELVR